MIIAFFPHYSPSDPIKTALASYPSFGEGIVQEVAGSGDTEQATVNFGSAIGLKRLLVSLSRLERG